MGFSLYKYVVGGVENTKVLVMNVWYVVSFEQYLNSNLRLALFLRRYVSTRAPGANLKCYMIYICTCDVCDEVRVFLCGRSEYYNHLKISKWPISSNASI